MNWISLLFYYVLVTAVTGDAMLLIWWVCRRLFVSWNPNSIYAMLCWSVLMFVLPVAFTATVLSYRRSYIIENGNMLDNFVFPVNLGLQYIYLAALLWFGTTLVNVGRFVQIAWCKYDLCRGNISEDDSQAVEVFEDVRKELGISGRVKLVRNDLLTSPLVTGVFRPLVILPYMKFEREELRVIFTHELLHIKKHDLYYKALSTWIVILQGFNPPAYFLIHLLGFWSEQDCDRKVMERLGSDTFTAHRYFEIIWKCRDEDTRKNRSIYSFSMLSEGVRNLERRIEFMNKYGKKVNKIPRVVTALFVAAFIFASSSVSYAAGIQVAQANDAAFKSAQKIYYADENVVDAENDLEEFTVSAEENALVTEVVGDANNLTRSGNSFGWTIPVGQRYVTTEKWLSKDTEVMIAVTVKPTDCTYWYGLMLPSGNSSVCETTGASSHTFTVPYSGFYRIMVENRSSSEITAVGSYQY